jgi:glycosyltransferase involved in cell wall biosynthesis
MLHLVPLLDRTDKGSGANAFQMRPSHFSFANVESSSDFRNVKTETLRLSVWIPTYNRLSCLRKSLSLLLPQLTAECELVILDNASDQDVATGIRDLIQDFHGCPVRVVRSPVNIGGNPNILRCLEQARGEWTWVLGDDDLPMPGVVASILKETGESPDLTLINFVTFCLTSRGCRNESVVVEGIEGLVQALDSYSNLLFISASVFNRRKIEKYIDQAYWYVPSCGPHVALLLIVLRAQGGKVKLSATKIIEQQLEPMAWNRRGVTFYIQKLLELIPDRRLRTLWFQKSLSVLPCQLPGPVQILKIRLGSGKQEEDLADDLELAYYLNHRVSGLRFKTFLIRMIAVLPDFLFYPLRVALPWARRLTGKKLAVLENFSLVQARSDDIRK